MLGPKVMLLGASGLIGNYCLTRLLEESEVKQVVAPARRPLESTHPKLAEHLIDFDELPKYGDLFEVDTLFCCLGTTLNAAGSREAFEKVDFGYVQQAAKLAAGKQVRQFLLVSAYGSDSRSPVFYSRIKGRAEQAVQKLPFDCVHILRPSMLLGSRSRPRLKEELLKPLANITLPLFFGPLRRLRPVQAEAVAGLMVDLAKGDYSGVHVHYPSANCG